MSFLPVSGKIYICDECDKHIRVEYEGGAQLTQIGDDNIREQMQISEKFNQPNKDPDTEGYYLYEIIICEDCYSKIDENIRELLKEILDKYKSLITVRNETIKAIEIDLLETASSTIETITPEEVENIFPEIKDELNDKRDTPKKRKGKINKFIRGYNTKEKVKELFYSSVDKNKSIEETFSGFNQQVYDTANLLPEFDDDEFAVMQPKDIRDAENLNNHLQFETTIREPKHDTKAETVYITYLLSTASFMNLMLNDEDYELEMEEGVLEIDEKVDEYISKSLEVLGIQV